eukprot:CAMPEP_0197745196 /NCGR_PEP_ID=MMETSP1435-20131217/41573_1 /TAXON_ID=426625 /ORGANISM="Chaetoceros brevis, Strain CCMP164" /LENGTH=229 /DNA_ID=CAMNT_0043336855 /DNA_START=71 /DNA_END=760 /DNA_ORIENTATION=-
MMQGDAEYVDTDNSNGLPTTGDLTIGEIYTAVSGVPNQSGGIRNISLDFKSVCAVTKDQFPGAFSSPSCQYEFGFKFCRRNNSNCREGTFSAHGSGPDKIRITGGADGFFGAFGQITTTQDFNTGTVEANGDLTGSTVEMKIEICYYDVLNDSAPTIPTANGDLTGSTVEMKIEICYYDVLNDSAPTIPTVPTFPTPTAPAPTIPTVPTRPTRPTRPNNNVADVLPPLV